MLVHSPFAFRVARFFVLGSVVVAVSGCNLPQFSATRDFEKTITVNSKTEIIADTFNGSIEVTPGQANEIQLIAHLRAYGDSAANAESRLESLTPEIDTSTDSITLRCMKPKDQTFVMDSVNLEIKAPIGWPLRLTTSNGKVSCDGILGPVAIKTSNGRISVKRASGLIDVSTSNGTIAIENTEGKIHAETSNGRIELEGCTLSGDSELDTSNGAISVSLDPKVSIAIIAKTSNGSMKCEGSSMEIEEKTSNRLKGVLKSSSSNAMPPIQLDINTSNGSVTIKQQESRSAETIAL